MGIEEHLENLSWFRIDAHFEAKNSSNTYVYSVIEAVTKEINRSLAYSGDLIYHVDKTPFSKTLRESETFKVSFVLPQASVHDADLWSEALQTYFLDPWNSRNVKLLKVSSPIHRNYSILLSGRCDIQRKDEICLHFLTPTPITPKHPKKRAHISLDDFLSLFTSRIRRLFDVNLDLKVSEDSVSFLPYWYYEEYPVHSSSQELSTRLINGCAGKVFLKGDYSSIFPLLIICEELHVGTSVSYGRGYYVLLSEASFVNQRDLMDSLQFYVEKNREHYVPSEKKKITQELYREILEATYEPKPPEEFVPEDKEIKVEKLFWKDRVVLSLLYKLLKNPLDNVLPLTVYSFRPHLSVNDIREKVEELTSYGFSHVLSFSLSGFYTNIRHDILLRLLGELIPNADQFIVKLIEKFLEIGRLENGRDVKRDKGIPLGSPLSPLLSNVYLLKVDRSLVTEDTIALRYADTYLLMSKTEEGLKHAFEKAKKMLLSLGLKISESSVKRLEDGQINFAGVEIEKKEKEKRLRKPVYVSNQDLSLKVDQDTLCISSSSKKIENIPLSRISEVVILSDIKLTTPLLRKLAKSDIPVVISSNFSSSLVLTRKDFKAHYDSIFRHKLKYDSLSEDDILLYAKEIASLKLLGYEILFAKRRHPKKDRIIDAIRYYRGRITGAKTLDVVRGYEALCSRQILKALNQLIDDSYFHISMRKREHPDPVNSLMNICSHVVFNKIRTLAHSLSLNPYLGFLHSPDNTYESLCADIQELLRARMDNFILNILNLRIIQKKDFVESEKGSVLDSEGVRKFLKHMEDYLNRRYGSTDMTIYDFIYRQLQRLRQWVAGEVDLRFEIPW